MCHIAPFHYRPTAQATLTPMPMTGVEYEVQRVLLPHTLSRGAVRRVLSEQAEYGGWELTRLRRYRDGTREVWIRRKIIRVRPTI